MFSLRQAAGEVGHADENVRVVRTEHHPSGESDARAGQTRAVGDQNRRLGSYTKTKDAEESGNTETRQRCYLCALLSSIRRVQYVILAKLKLVVRFFPITSTMGVFRGGGGGGGGGGRGGGGGGGVSGPPTKNVPKYATCHSTIPQYRRS